MTSQAICDEEIWVEPEHRLDRDQLYGSDKMYDRGACFSVRKIPDEKTAFGLRLRNGRLGEAGRILLDGHGIASTHARTGLWINTLRILLAVVSIKHGGPVLCPCSRPSSHAGRCLFRMKDRRRNIEPQFRSIHIKHRMRILDCGCYIEPILGARIISCESKACCAERKASAAVALLRRSVARCS